MQWRNITQRRSLNSMQQIEGKKKAVSLCCLIELGFEFADKDEFVSYVGK